VSIQVTGIQRNWFLLARSFCDVAVPPFVLCSSRNAFLSSLGGGLGAGLRSNIGSDGADAANILCDNRRSCEDSMVCCTISLSCLSSTFVSCENS
jgi:hypothetical protein